MFSLSLVELISIVKVFILCSVFFVWVVRYANIVNEFDYYKYPNWLRDLVGILKLSFAVMIQNENVLIVKFGAVGIILLMFMAVLTHFKVKNKLKKMLPSLILLLLCVLVFRFS